MLECVGDIHYKVRLNPETKLKSFIVIGLDRILNQTQMRIFREFEMDLGLDRLFEQHVPEEAAQSFFLTADMSRHLYYF